MKTLNELFEHTLRDVYFAEKAILKALPKMSKKASSSTLSEAFDTHTEETQGHVERLEQVFKMIGAKAQGERCPAIEGIIEESQELMKDSETSTVCDAAMLAAAQAVEHYEISRYGTLVSWAGQLGLDDAADLLQETLEEEINTDETLTDLAEEEINSAAMGDDEDSESEEEDEDSETTGKPVKTKSNSTGTGKSATKSGTKSAGSTKRS